MIHTLKYAISVEERLLLYRSRGLRTERERTMTNYEKYAGTPERFAELVIQLDCEGGAGEELTRQFCRGGCYREDDDADCTDENLKKCIMAWLVEEA